MIVLALLPDLLLGRLRTALGAHETIIAATSVEDDDGLAPALQRGDVDLVVLDPGDRRLEHRTRTLTALLARYAAVPVLLYTPLTTTSIALAAHLLPGGTRRLLLAGVEDQPGATRALAVRMTMDALAQRFLASVESQLAALPTSVVRAIHTLFASPRRFQSVEDIALASAVTRRHLERVTRRAGFASCRELLIIARTLAAFRLLQHEHRSLGQIAARLDVHPRVLGRQVRTLLGASSTFDLARLSADELLAACSRALCRQPAQSPHPAQPRTRRVRSGMYDDI
ncbi:MAG TPA: hypothetical protein VJR24_08810 [Gemmatimonadaceae bacterium]|nr:hypothetical protein [Gemmatimonadaceae bacterium]